MAGYVGAKAYALETAPTEEERRKIFAETVIEAGAFYGGIKAGQAGIRFLETPRIKDIFEIPVGKAQQIERQVMGVSERVLTKYKAGELSFVSTVTPRGIKGGYIVRMKGATGIVRVGEKLPSGLAMRELDILKLQKESLWVGGRKGIGVPLKLKRVAVGKGAIKTQQVIGIKDKYGRVVSEYKFDITYNKLTKQFKGIQKTEFMKVGKDVLKFQTITTPTGKPPPSISYGKIKFKQIKVPKTTTKITPEGYVVREGVGVGYEYIGGIKKQVIPKSALEGFNPRSIFNSGDGPL